MVEKKFTSIETLALYTCHIIGWFWNVFTFYPWFYLSGNFKNPRLGKIQAKSISSSPAGPYRNLNHFGKLISGFGKVKTLDVLFRHSVEQHGDRGCMGTRELLSEEDEVQPNGRIFKKVILGEYKWLSYNEAYDHARRISSGIKALGVETGEFVVIFAETKAEWMLSAQACFMRNFPVVTIYATLGDEALVHGFNEAESKFIMTDAALLPKLKKLSSQLHFIKTIVFFGDAKKSLINEFPEHIKIYSLQQVIDLGSKLKNIEVPAESPKPDDIAVVMYTSGSTGVPKGVIISHLNITSALCGMISGVPLGPSQRYIAYLPLAHIMELICECACLSFATPIGYSSALTLSDQSSKIKKGSEGDASILKPTLMCAVPMIMDRMRKAVIDKVNSGPRAAQLFFKFAYDYKLKQIQQGYDTPLLNRVLFNKVRGILGGCLSFMLSGGAPLSKETEEFMNVCFCCPVGQGYGLTETCAGGTLCEAWDQSTGRVGRPVGSAEVKLESWEEGGYTVNDKPNPRGEIIIGGTNVSLGYWKQEEKTAESFKVDDNGQRWFYTGDIGEVESDGVLKIIDRKKDLIKLAHGEYVSLGKVEATLKHSKYVENCCAYGDSQESYILVLVVPVAAQLHTLATSLGVDGSLEELCSNKTVVEAVLKDVTAVSKEAKLNKSETPSKLKLCVEQWTPESELVTAAFKLKRKNIQNFYEKDLEMLYLN